MSRVRYVVDYYDLLIVDKFNLAKHHLLMCRMHGEVEGWCVGTVEVHVRIRALEID